MTIKARLAAVTASIGKTCGKIWRALDIDRGDVQIVLGLSLLGVGIAGFYNSWPLASMVVGGAVIGVVLLNAIIGRPRTPKA